MREAAPVLRRWEWLLLLVGLTAFAAQAAFSSPQKSAAFDEQYHLTRGYAYLQTGDFRLSRSHPPLVNLLSALPLLARSDVVLPLDHPTWQDVDYFLFSDAFMWQANEDPQALLELARLPIIALGTLLVGILFFWARRLAGPVAGWTALVLAVFDPNLLANSRLVTTDLGLTFFFLLATWRLWCWLERPTRLNFVLAGLAAGLTTASKFTGLMIWPTFLLILLLHRNFRGRPWLALGRFLALGLLGYLALWAVYGLDVGPIPGTGFPLPIPAPFYPHSAWLTFTEIQEAPKTAYLLGETSPRGWWYYFPVALGVKTPLPLLLLSLSSLTFIWERRDWRRTMAIWLPPTLFLALSMTGRLAIGYRHILPIVPFLILLGSYAAAASWRIIQRPSPARAVLIVLLLWQAADVLRLYPHQEAYFNQIAGGPRRGDEFLVDSNLDWGQDLIALQEVLEEREVEEVYLSYFGSALPERYGINYKPLPGYLRLVAGPEIEAYNPYTPPPGWYAISVSSLHLGLFRQNLDIYAYFRDRDPVARAGYSINLYHVEYLEETPLLRTVVTGRSVADIPPEELGVQPDARVIAKWTASANTTIFPTGTEEPPPVPEQAVRATFGEAFTLLGFDADRTAIRPGQAVQLTLYWRVESGEVPRPAPAAAPPLAAFVHLSGEDPSQILSQYDGWGTALTGLETGDVIAQEVALETPAEMPPGSYFLQAGLYSPQSGRRLSLGDDIADYVVLGPVAVGEGEPAP